MNRNSIGTSGVLPPSIMPVVIMSGSDYEMGYQYGQQAAPYIEMLKFGEWASALRRFGKRERVVAELQVLEQYVREYCPEAIEQMRGISDGAISAGCEVSYTDILLTNSGMTNNFPLTAEDEEVPPDGCSVFSAWGRTTSDGRLICGDTKDSPFTCQVALVAFPENGNHYMLSTAAGQIAEHFAFNDKGVFIGTSAGRARRRIDFDKGLPRLFAVLHALQFARTAAEAKEMVAGWSLAGPWNLHFSDVSGNAFVAEVTAAIKCFRKPGDFGESDFIYSTNNYFMDPMRETIAGEKFIPHAGWLGRSSSISSVSRNLQIWNLLQNYQGKVDLEFIKMMLRFPGQPAPYPIDKKAYYATQGEGWEQRVLNLRNMRASIVMPEKDGKGSAYICTGPASRVAYPSGAKGGDWYPIEGTHAFYRLALASSPAAVVSASKTDAHACIGQAYRELMMLSYKDPGYSVLNDLFSQAVSEYYRGANAHNRGVLARGNEALSYFSEAATAFARAQVRAKQAYNALVPPASTPEQLALPPYGGPWAKWATK
jgi:hypothetical protein